MQLREVKVLAQGQAADEQQGCNRNPGDDTEHSSASPHPGYLYLFFFFGVRVGVLPLEGVASQLPLDSEACGGDALVSPPLVLPVFCTQGGSKSGGGGLVPTGLPNRVSST